jgi:alpha-methylacyl-CoA racemase
MLLADMGADVIRIDPPGAASPRNPVVERSRASLVLDLKTEEGRGTCLAAIDRADVVIESFRPGVMERLGLGPDIALARNPRLVYGRMTGWGQDGPLAQSAGHDITYIALTGALAATGPAVGSPVPPLTLVGDYGGGALYLALGVMMALFERGRSGKGQVVDAAIVDGVASLMASFQGMVSAGRIDIKRGRNLLGGFAPNYHVYICADGRHVAVGPLEPQFYAELRERLGLAPSAAGASRDPADWPNLTEELQAVFKTQTRDEWAKLLEGTDACVAPVLDLNEAPGHGHLRARRVYVDVHGIVQAGPAPRFSRTPGKIQGSAPNANEGGRERLMAWGVTLD